MKLTTKIVAVAAVAVSGVALTAVPAAAGPYYECYKGYVCMWEDAGWHGDEWVHWKPANNHSGYEIDWWNGDNEISSVYNHSSYAIRIYSNDGYGGRSLCLSAGHEIGTMKDYGFNDDAESVKTAAHC